MVKIPLTTVVVCQIEEVRMFSSSRQVRRTPLLALLALSAVLTASPFASRALAQPRSQQEVTPALAHDPILFVHGWTGSASNWNTMISRFKADGWATNELYSWTYNSSQSNATIAQEIKTRVD